MHTLQLLFNDVDGYEVLVIILVVLIFFGPKSIPGIAKTLGRALFSIRNASEELKNEIRKSGVDIKKDLNINDILKQQESEMLQPMDQVFSDIGNTMHYEGNKVKTIIEQNQEESHALDPQPQTQENLEVNKPNIETTPSNDI
ncbi:MAG: twin-arginine translocase TatA/TatE family subunit [Flavobacteriales bacterium]